MSVKEKKNVILYPENQNTNKQTSQLVQVDDNFSSALESARIYREVESIKATQDTIELKANPKLDLSSSIISNFEDSKSTFIRNMISFCRRHHLNISLFCILILLFWLLNHARRKNFSIRVNFKAGRAALRLLQLLKSSFTIY